MSRGFLIAAPQSGSGKTTVTLGLLRALRNRGLPVFPAKAGPDYIDPAFHAAASGTQCINLDPWAMRLGLLRALVARTKPDETLVVEGMMGLYDGAADGSGSAADLAAMLGLPVVLVVDVSGQAHSVAALIQGFSNFDQNIEIKGVIFNKIGSRRHEEMLRHALEQIAVPVFGAIGRNDALTVPSRHLGLVQAAEHKTLNDFLDDAAREIEDNVDLDALLSLKRKSLAPKEEMSCIAPIGQKIAIARDEAFAFIYPHLVDDWLCRGAEISFFSPLSDESPADDCTAVYLPGGYPELHAGKIASNDGFLDGLRRCAEAGAFVYGECGGYMVLGDGLVDADGKRHKMAGLLRLETSFAARKLHLGYRVIDLQADTPLGQSGASFSAHEFHYSSILSEKGYPLFVAKDALKQELGAKGTRSGSVGGSFMHLIDRR